MADNTPALLEKPAALSASERAGLTAGVDFWHVVGVPSLGLPPLLVTDGPSGARGPAFGSALSTSFPCGTALAATWDVELIDRVGRALAAEARAKGAGLLLGPTVNVVRHPLAGRNFESFSEDPVLSAEIAVAYINGVQSQGVGCAVKHLVCNDQERDRMTLDVQVDEAALREIYLPAFEAAVRRAQVWVVMAAYNKLGGAFCTENTQLLQGILRKEWGFDGLVVSDWFATHSASAVEAGVDLEMPGPAAHLGAHLVQAQAAGTVSAEAVDRAADRVVQLLRRATAEEVPDHADCADVSYEAAVTGAVLLRNNDLLPLQGSGLRIALLGPFASRLSHQGGGSAEVTAPYVVSPLEALNRKESISLVHAPGCSVPGDVPQLDPALLSVAGRARQLRVDFFEGSELAGAVLASESSYQPRLIWLTGPNDSAAGTWSARVHSTFTPDSTGLWRFGLVSAGASRLLLDGEVVCDNTTPVQGISFFGAGSTEVTGVLELVSGQAYRLEAEIISPAPQGDGPPLTAVQIGAELVLDAEQALAAAVRAAAASDVAVVVVGTDGRWESEGFDRPSMALPGNQDALVAAVAAANPRTIVVLNCGAPVEMPWIEDVAAVLQLWFPGQEGGRALADLLLGDAEPTGRLPMTLPKLLSDSPAAATYASEADGQIAVYAEGLQVGYRHFDTHDVDPLFCFGHGLSYTTFAYEELTLSEADQLTVRVRNTGARLGVEVTQLYVQQPGRTPALRAFRRTRLAPGEAATVTFPLNDRDFARWDDGWKIAAGEHVLRIGSSSRDLRASLVTNRREAAL